MSVTYDFNDTIHYFGDYSQLVGLLVMITCLMGPLSLYACLRDTTIYADLNEQTRRLWGTLKNLSVFYIFILLFSCFMILGTNDYSLGVTGTYSSSDMRIDCKDCCAIFHECSEGVANTLDYDTHVFSQNGECPSLADIAIFINPDVSDCSDTEFGCCSLRTTCDDYVRLRKPYDIYKQAIGKGYPIGYVETGVKRLDPNGTQCPSGDDYIREYTGDMYSRHGGRVVLYIGFFLFIVVSPCWIYRDEIYEEIVDHMTYLYRKRCPGDGYDEPPTPETPETLEAPGVRETSKLSLSPATDDYELP